ncbi:MAG: hypothetical protein KBC30_01855 [Planctomycetes bacterium]|nr:hypothetical protein [Planctomycetota bacterium]HPY74354.1 hypothetical protein [Planctomycetota bacterium]HQA99880.1 hypothetical protein [Planctomycetota bacterium]HRU51525.1 hypothetical protein [Planctomycetota bacterium]
MQKKIFFILFCLIFCTSCQLPMSNYMRDNVFPTETTSKIIMSPILLPTYAVCCVADIVLVNPVRGCKNVPNVVSTIWQWENTNPWIGYGALAPVKIIAIPPAVVGTAIFSEQFIYSENM